MRVSRREQSSWVVFASRRDKSDRGCRCCTVPSTRRLFSASPNAKHQRALRTRPRLRVILPLHLANNNVLFGACTNHSHTNKSAFEIYSSIFHTLYIDHLRTVLVTPLNAMSANSSVSLASKNACNPSQTSSPSQSQSASSIGIEAHTQRRVGGSGSFGTGSTSRSISSTARNNQSLRKQHKGQRRPRLADEDAAAESVS